MRTIRFSRHRRSEDEAEGAESILALGRRLPAKADDGARAFDEPG